MCLDVTVIASVKANIIKQGAVETALAANKPSLEMERDQHSPDTGSVVWTLGVGGALWGGFAVWRGALASSHGGANHRTVFRW